MNDLIELDAITPSLRQTWKGAYHHGGPHCGESSGRQKGWVCTRKPGHQGPHVAHAGAAHLCAIWGWTGDPDLALVEGL